MQPSGSCGGGNGQQPEKPPIRAPPAQQPKTVQVPQQVVISLNEKLYANAKSIFEQRSPALLEAYSSDFIDEVVKHL
jgi:hypothetical protein